MLEFNCQVGPHGFSVTKSRISHFSWIAEAESEGCSSDVPDVSSYWSGLHFCEKLTGTVLLSVVSSTTTVVGGRCIRVNDGLSVLSPP